MKRAVYYGLGIVLLTVAGCRWSKKTVWVKDGCGHAVANCMIYAAEENILPGNDSALFFTDQEGKAEIPYFSLVAYYAGLPQYYVTYKSSAAKEVNITLHDCRQVPEKFYILNGKLSESDLQSIKDENALEYFSSSVIISERLHSEKTNQRQ